MAKRWNIHPHDPSRTRDIEQVAGVSPVLAQILCTRLASLGVGSCGCPASVPPVGGGANGNRNGGGITLSEIRSFLEAKLSDLAPPENLPGCVEAARRIVEAVREGRCICVYGDYDVDGMTATAILRRCLVLLGAKVRYHIPCRMDDGYGLHDDYLEQVARSDPGAMVITVDCGITSMEQALTARRLGLELIITDHHEPGETLPEVSHIVHPRLPGADSGFGYYSGAGVALKLAWAICQEYCGAKRVPRYLQEFLVQAVGIASLGTIADVVPLLGDNRVIVKNGLRLLRNGAVPVPTPTSPSSVTKTISETETVTTETEGVSATSQAPPSPIPAMTTVEERVTLSSTTAGILELLRVSNLLSRESLEAEDVAFRLAPRLNAAGRLGQALLAAELLITDDASRAADLASHVDRLNNDRQTLERKVYLAADRQARELFDPENDPALVLADREWHPGVVGIVAGRLAEKYNRPTILISQDRLGMRAGTGSARGAGELNLVEALGACREFLVRCGGHASAAGLAVEDGQLSAFRSAFCEYVSQRLGTVPEPELIIDAEVPLSMINEHLMDELDRLAPFGQSNRRPIFCSTRVYLAERVRCIGAGSQHLAFAFVQGNGRIRGVSFGTASRAPEFDSHVGAWDIAFRPVWNVFRGRRSVELQLEDWRPASDGTET